MDTDTPLPASGGSKQKSKWSIHRVPDLPESTVRRISDLRRSGVNTKHLDAAIKDIVWDYKIYSKQNSGARNSRFAPMPPAELARIRLSNLSYLHCAESSLRIKDVFRAMSESRILAHKHDLSLMPEKLELALAFVRIASTADANIRRSEWAAPHFAMLVKKYQRHADSVVKSIQTHGVVDERLIDAEVAGISGALQDGSL
jgi:hypothetical protein